MQINNKLFTILFSLVMAIVTWIILYILVSVTGSIPAAERFFSLLGGTTGGYIQFFCYIAFFYGLIEMRRMHASVKKEFEGFDLNLLPAEDQLVLSPDQVADVKLNIIDLEKKGINFKVADFIKKACTQYRNDQSVSETLQVLDVQIENNKEELEGNLSMVKYLMGSIMSLGFIGTLIGLSKAIGNAHLAKTEEGMPLLTQFLNVAFDTTLVALILGLILNYFYHSYTEDIDKFYAKSKTYIVDNLISRIYIAK